MAFGAVSPGAQRGPADVEWRHYSGDNGSTKYSPLAQITKDNISRLRMAWRRPHSTPRCSNRIRSCARQQLPLDPHHGRRRLVCVERGRLGRGVRSRYRPDDLGTAGAGERAPRWRANRGVAYWSQGAKRTHPDVPQPVPYALDARTENRSQSSEPAAASISRRHGRREAYSWNGTPLVVRDVVVLGSSMADQDSAARMTGVSGDVYGFDVRTGQLRWTFRPIPRAGEPGVETWENESWRYTGAANVWAPMSADDELGYGDLPTSSATNDM